MESMENCAPALQDVFCEVPRKRRGAILHGSKSARVGDNHGKLASETTGSVLILQLQEPNWLLTNVESKPHGPVMRHHTYQRKYDRPEKVEPSSVSQPW